MNRIRVETACSRFPIHCLARNGTIPIDLHEENGTAYYKWEVTYNSKHGQPGPLAYKIDTLVINRILDQLGRPLPEIVRIGSLSDICGLLGNRKTGPNMKSVKSALLQNATAFINAKIRYKNKEKRRNWAEIAYTRYSVVFTGESLPDGAEADAVYIVLNPPYRELLNHVETRPLDYDYLRRLSAGAQRLYELLSLQMFGAISAGRECAKMLYSDYCKCAPQTRCNDFDHMKKQMHKLHLPHRQSGYIATIKYEQTVDAQGKPDWRMFYTPGPKAIAEYEAFTSRRVSNPVTKAPDPAPRRKRANGTQGLLDLTAYDPEMVRELVSRGIQEKTARELLSDLQPGQNVLDQVEYVDFILANDKHHKIANPPGLYVHHIRANTAPPPNFCSPRKRAAEAEREQIRSANLNEAYNQYYQAALQSAESLPQYETLFEQKRSENRGSFRSAEKLNEVTRQSVLSELERTGQLRILSLNEFVAMRFARVGEEREKGSSAPPPQGHRRHTRAVDHVAVDGPGGSRRHGAV